MNSQLLPNSRINPVTLNFVIVIEKKYGMGDVRESAFLTNLFLKFNFGYERYQETIVLLPL